MKKKEPQTNWFEKINFMHITLLLLLLYFWYGIKNHYIGSSWPHQNIVSLNKTLFTMAFQRAILPLKWPIILGFSFWVYARKIILSKDFIRRIGVYVFGSILLAPYFVINYIFGHEIPTDFTLAFITIFFLRILFWFNEEIFKKYIEFISGFYFFGMYVEFSNFYFAILPTSDPKFLAKQILNFKVSAYLFVIPFTFYFVILDYIAEWIINSIKNELKIKPLIEFLKKL